MWPRGNIAAGIVWGHLAFGSTYCWLIVVYDDNYVVQFRLQIPWNRIRNTCYARSIFNFHIRSTGFSRARQLSTNSHQLPKRKMFEFKDMNFTSFQLFPCYENCKSNKRFFFEFISIACPLSWIVAIELLTNVVIILVANFTLLTVQCSTAVYYYSSIIYSWETFGQFSWPKLVNNSTHRHVSTFPYDKDRQLTNWLASSWFYLFCCVYVCVF